MGARFLWKGRGFLRLHRGLREGVGRGLREPISFRVFRRRNSDSRALLLVGNVVVRAGIQVTLLLPMHRM